MRFAFIAARMKQACLLAVLFVAALCGRSAHAQNLFTPTIPPEKHRSFVEALRLDANDAALADLAYAAYRADMEGAGAAHHCRNRWMMSMEAMEDIQADDDALMREITFDWFRFEIAWHAAIARIESTYFDALAALEPGGRHQARSLQRGWQRSWLLRSSAIPPEALPGTTLDLIDVLDTAHIDPQAIPGLPPVILAYEAEVAEMLDRLMAAIIHAGDDHDSLSQAGKAAMGGDWPAAMRLLDKHLDTAYASWRVLESLRETNAKFSRQIDALLPWRASLAFRARVRPKLDPFLLDPGIAIPEQRLLESLRMPPDLSEKQLDAARTADEAYNRAFLELVAAADPLYASLHGFSSIRQTIRSAFAKELGKDDPPPDHAAERQQLDSKRREAQKLISKALQQITEAVGGKP